MDERRDIADFLEVDYEPGAFNPYIIEHRTVNLCFQTSRLCEECENVRQAVKNRHALEYQIGGFTYVKTGPRKQYVPLAHYGVVDELRISARSGCHLCSLLLPEPEDHMRAVNSSYRLFLFKTGSTAPFRFDLSLARPISATDSRAFAFRKILTIKSSPLKPTNLLLGRLTTASTSTRQWLRNRLEDCILNHETCAEVSTLSVKLPTRLIAIDADHSEQSTVRLVSPIDDGISNIVPYLALSYCWGTSETVRLTKNSQDAFRAGLPVRVLPKSHKDAISVCQWLGIKFLWIDSLCIIQDDDEDWIEEAAKMCDVYQNAILTIAAAGAKDVSQGCFALSNPLCYLPVQLDRDADGAYWYCGPKENFTMPGGGTVFFQGPLKKRGWAFQERLLSRRTVHFGEMVVFECDHGLQDDLGGPHAKGLEDNLHKAKEELNALLAKRQTNVEQSNARTALQRLWQTIVRTYSTTQFSHREDKVAALVGIVDLIKRNSSFNYICGYWEPLQVDSFLWEVSHRKALYDRGCTNDRAPSWSWLSADCEIDWAKARTGSDVTSLCTIKGIRAVDTRLINRITFEKAELVLHGSLCKLLEIRDHYPDGIMGGLNKAIGSMMLTVKVEDLEGTTEAFITPDYWVEDQRNFDFRPKDEKASEHPLSRLTDVDPTDIPPFHGFAVDRWCELYFLPMQRHEKHCAGLILCPALDASARYMRVGVMNLEDCGDDFKVPSRREEIVLI